MIEVRNLVKIYGKQSVIKDVSLHIDKGDSFGIVGKSGVGKSTLLRCMNALETFDDGDILIAGRSIRALNRNGIRELRKDVSMIFQNFNLLNQKTALENVALPMEIWGYPRIRRMEKAKELLDLVGLSGKYHSKPRNLSGGEKQRVAVARALSLDPKILLCDEATSALDPRTTKEILTLLKRISTDLGLTLVVVTHQMEVVKDLCRKVAVMEDGRIAAMGNVEDLFLNPEKSLKKLIGEDDPEVLPEGVNIRIFFTREFSGQAIITTMARELETDFSIIWGKLENFGGSILGSLVISIRASDKERITAYLEEKGLNMEVLNHEL